MERARKSFSRSLSILIAIIMVILLFSVSVMAADNIAEGTLGSVVWTIDADGNMVFSPAEGDEGTLERVVEGHAPWQEQLDKIKTVSFTGTIHAAPNSSYLFAYMTALESIDFTNFDSSAATNMEGFMGEAAVKSVDLKTLDTSNVTNFSFFFYDCQNLEDVDLTGFVTSESTTFLGMFYHNQKLTSVDLSSFDVSKATTFRSMFQECHALETLDLGTFNAAAVTGNGLKNMFRDCYSLKEADLSNVDFAKVTDISNMFSYCRSLESVVLPEEADMKNVTNMSYMFMGCSSLKTIDLSGVTTSTKLSRAESVFGICESLEYADLSGLNITNVSYFSDFMHGCEKLTTLVLGENFYTPKNLSNGFIRGIWRYSEDGKDYASTEISGNLETGPMAGTFTKITENALEIPYSVDYAIGTFNSIADFSTTNPSIETDGTRVYMYVDGDEADDDGVLRVDGTVSFLLEGAIEDADGNPYNLKVTYSNIVLYDAAYIQGTDEYNVPDVRATEYVHHFFRLTDDGRFVVQGEDHFSLTYETDPAISPSSSYDITLQILDQDGNVAEGVFLFSIYDLDVASVQDKAAGQPASVERPTHAYGLYSEGVYLKDGFDLDTIVVADNTYLNLVGESGDYEGYRVHGTQIDSASERTDLIVCADASGATFTWTGFSCEDFLLYRYQPKTVYIDKVNEADEKVAGAEFEVYRVEEGEDDELIDSWTSDDEDSHTLLLRTGSYYLHEAEAPEHFGLADDIYFMIDTDFDMCDVDGNKLGNGNSVKMADPHDPIGITVLKVWDDADDQDGKRPDSITARLLVNGEAAELEDAEAELSEENKWTYTWTDLQMYIDGELAEYTVEEDPGDDYEGETAVEQDETTGFITITLTNTHEPETTEATVIKIWDDADDQDGMRPDSLSVSLSNGTDVISTVELNEENGWKATVGDLPKYASGKEIEYTWTEEDLPEGYKLSSTSIEGTVTTLTNSHEPEKTEVSVKKTWVDDNNEGGKRPGSITVNLFADGEKTASLTVRPDDKGSWTCTFTDLDKYKAGKEIEYTVSEDEVEGYKTEITGDMKEGYVITNTRDGDTPPTGDSANILPYVLMMAVSLSCLAVLVIKRKKG